MRMYIICLLYTSDAADDLLCVDLGGRRIIKKILARKNKNEEHELQIEKLQEELTNFKGSLQQLQDRKQVNLPESTLKKAVNKAISDKAAKEASAKMKAQFELKIRTKEDAGMPDDFKGSMQDVFDALKYGIYEHEDVYYLSLIHI